MSRRLSTGGRLIDRGRPLRFRFDGLAMTGFAGDTLASALLAQGRLLQGRSFKYHRPRGPLAAGVEEPNALMTVGTGRRMEPNQRATTQELYDGLTASSQNRWPSLDRDVGAISASLSRLLPAGFYYKMFKWPQAFWKHVYEPAIRQAAGLGPAPRARDADLYEHLNVTVEVLVIGGGISGLQAALAAASGGARVLVLEQTAHWGGRAPVDGVEIDGQPAEDWVRRTVEALSAMPNVRLRSRITGAGVYDHGWALGYENVGDHLEVPPGPRHRLWKIRARRIVTATGAIERPLVFAGNDLPGVMLAAALRDYVVNWAVTPGGRTVVVTNNDDAYRTALALHRAGEAVVAVLDARDAATGALPDAVRALGIRVETGAEVIEAVGSSGVTGLRVAVRGAREDLACDVVAMSGGWSPVVHLWSHCGGKLAWDADQALFRPDPARPPTGADGTGFVLPAGAANGVLTAAAGLDDATRAGQRAAEEVGHPGTVEVPAVAAPIEAPMRPVWMMPAGAGPALREKMFLDFQNDVKVSDVALAAQEGYESVEHAKRYTTLGMATDQGKLSNINGLAVLADARGVPIPQVGTTTFRPPYTPVSMGAIAGEARGALFQPVRRTALHDRHQALGATWEPVGQWRRPFAYPRAGESVADAVAREVLAVREAAGMLDASTLGKILVKGPDAGRLLDMIYTGAMSTVPVGRCRYGLICSENGFLVDDGVVARLAEDTWLCHTTTGGADRIHAHMEEWLQTEWWDWKVFTLNLTEQFAQVAVAGPEARNVLEVLGGMDVSGRRTAVHALGRGNPGRPCGAGVPDLLLGRVVVRGRGRRIGRAGALGRAEPGRRAVRPDPLRHRGYARPARREGIHHDRRRDRRHRDPAGPRPRLGGLEEEGGLHRQAGAGARPHDRSRALAAGRARDAGRLGPPGRRPGACRGRDRERPAADTGAGHVDLPLAHAGPRHRDGPRAARTRADGRGAGVLEPRRAADRGTGRLAGVPRPGREPAECLRSVSAKPPPPE